MSGFIGLISAQLQERDSSLLDRAADIIAQCCDDYTGKWQNERIGLRFGWFNSTDDCDADQLPFSVAEYRIVGDVRLDNREEIVEKLRPYFEDVTPYTPDSYLLLYAYIHWKEECVQYISGDYAFAIWDEHTESLFCARDHFGVVPLYYTCLEDRFIFTNYYSSLKSIPNLMEELNNDVLADYLTTGVNQSFENTIYIKLKKLPPAHILIYRGGQIRISSYWKIPTDTAPIRYNTTKEYVKHFYTLFEKSIAERTRTNKVACQLSGGMDSSAVTATTQEVLRSKYGSDHTVQTLNIIYNWLIKENEGFFAELTAQQLAIPMKQYIAEDYLKNSRANSMTWIPEPVGIPAATAENHMLEDVEIFSSVLLSGFGGDVLFCYDKPTNRKSESTISLFQSFKDSLLFYRNFGRFANIGLRQKLMGWVNKSTSAQSQIPSYYNQNFFAAHGTKPEPEGVKISPRSYYAMLANPYWSWLFETAHPGFTGKKVRIRHPFFSKDLLLFVLALPPHLLYQKSLLRMATMPLLPLEVVQRPKTVLYGNPYFQNLNRQDVKKELEKVMEEAGDFATGIFDMENMRKELHNVNSSPTFMKNMLIVINILAWQSCKP